MQRDMQNSHFLSVGPELEGRPLGLGILPSIKRDRPSEIKLCQAPNHSTKFHLVTKDLESVRELGPRAKTPKFSNNS